MRCLQHDGAPLVAARCMARAFAKITTLEKEALADERLDQGPQRAVEGAFQDEPPAIVTHGFSSPRLKPLSTNAHLVPRLDTAQLQRACPPVYGGRRQDSSLPLDVPRSNAAIFSSVV